MSNNNVGSAKIMQVKPKNRFAVYFRDGDGSKLPWADDISLMVESVSELTQTRNNLSANLMVLSVEDDDENLACNALQKLMQHHIFQVLIEFRNSQDKTIRTHVLKDCYVETIYHGDLSYSSIAMSFGESCEKLKKLVEIRYGNFEIK